MLMSDGRERPFLRRREDCYELNKQIDYNLAEHKGALALTVFQTKTHRTQLFLLTQIVSLLNLSREYQLIFS